MVQAFDDIASAGAISATIVAAGIKSGPIDHRIWSDRGHHPPDLLQLYRCQDPRRYREQDEE